MQNKDELLLISLGRRIDGLRKFRGMTITQLSAESAVARTYLHEIISGTRNPSVTIVNNIARALGVTAGALLIEEELIIQETRICIPQRR